MKFDINVTIRHEYTDPTSEGTLGKVLEILRYIHDKVSKMAVTLDDVKAAVTAESTVIQSAVTLLTELKAKLDEAIASDNMAKVKEIADAVGKNTQDLATAVQANTPPPSPPSPPTPTP